MDDTTTYEQLRARLLEYERNSQTWSAANILSLLSVQNDHAKHKEYQGPIPMEIDRLEWKGKGKGKMEKEKEKAKVEKAKKSSQKEDTVDLAADAEEEKDADAEKEEAKAEKEKGSSLDKWVRKVTEEKESLVANEKDRCATIAERQDTLLQSVIRILEKVKEEERVFGMFTVSMKIGIKKVNNGMRNGRIGTTMKDSSNSHKHCKHQAHRVSQV